MKKMYKFFTIVTTLAIVTCITLMPIDVSAIKIGVISPINGIEYLLDTGDVVVGWNEDGTPIIESHEVAGITPVSSLVKEETLGDSDTTVGDSDTTIGDSTDTSLNTEPTGIRGDVNYDGKVNVADIMLLRRYLLKLITW